MPAVCLTLSTGEDSFDLQTVALEMEVLEKQIRELHEKHARLRERKAALETSRADAHSSQVNSRVEPNAPSTSTPRVSLPRPSAPTTPAKVQHGPWMRQQRKRQAKPRSRTSPPPPLQAFEISTENRFAPLRETERDTVILGDSIVRHVRATGAKGKVHTRCFPGARVLDVAAQVPAVLKENFGAVVLHAGTNDTRLRQTEVLKRDFRILVETQAGMAVCFLHWSQGALVSTTPAQARFNTAHCKTRCAIERLNGVLKRRFACLYYLQMEPQGACSIILACIVLHNIATRGNVPLCDDVYDAPEPVEEPDQPLTFCQNEGLTGRITTTLYSSTDAAAVVHKQIFPDLFHNCHKSGGQYPLIPTVMCICESGRCGYYGVSLSCGSHITNKIMTAVSCLHVWHSRDPELLQLPSGVSCRAYKLKNLSKVEPPPCFTCNQLRVPAGS
ncbi:hypothetical protein C0J45_0833 [Silurus meridionalis]|nr:hypothetical protein C0J45_0833 [Silurus meridionalis]